MTEEVSQEKAQWIRAALDRYEGPLVRYARSIVGHLEGARDVVQETFLSLCKADPEKVGDRLAPWLFTVCRNRAFDLCKKEGRMNPLDDNIMETQASDDPDPAEVLEHSETETQVLAAVAGLPRKQQEVIRLKFQEGLSYRQIGEVTGHTASNVGFLIHTALKTIRERLDGRMARA
jgi:RNA polymerase sigma-70 factor (ECF subfamily)